METKSCSTFKIHSYRWQARSMLVNGCLLIQFMAERFYQEISLDCSKKYVDKQSIIDKTSLFKFWNDFFFHSWFLKCVSEKVKSFEYMSKGFSIFFYHFFLTLLLNIICAKPEMYIFGVLFCFILEKWNNSLIFAVNLENVFFSMCYIYFRCLYILSLVF